MCRERERVWCKREVRKGLGDKEDKLFTTDGYSFFIILHSRSHCPVLQCSVSAGLIHRETNGILTG